LFLKAEPQITGQIFMPIVAARIPAMISAG
jgi:hypothetical protein